MMLYEEQVNHREILWTGPYPGPYASPARRSIISRSGPRRRVNAAASNAATLSFGVDALTVAARGDRRRRDNSVTTISVGKNR